MLNLDTINKEILELEKHDTTFATCERLAWLYIIKDYLTEPIEKERISRMKNSDFFDAVSGKDLEAVMNILNEHMEAVKMVYPREFNAVIRKLNELDVTP